MAPTAKNSDRVVIELFLDMQAAERGASKNTLAAYARDLADVSAHLGAAGRSITHATTEDLRGYLGTLRKRGFGLNQVASMKMAPYVRPPMTPINVRNRNRLGMVNPLAGQCSTKQWRNWDGRPCRRPPPPRRHVNHSFAAPAVLPRRLTASGCVGTETA